MSGVRYVNQYAGADAMGRYHGMLRRSRAEADGVAGWSKKHNPADRRVALIVCRPKPAGAPKRYADEHERRAWEKFPTDPSRREEWRGLMFRAMIHELGGFHSTARCNRERAADL